MNQLQYNTGALRAPRMRETHSKNQRVFGAVFAVAVEAGLIYALLVSLGVTPAPMPVTITNGRVIPEVKLIEEPPTTPPVIEAPQLSNTITPEITLEYVPPQENVITPPQQPQQASLQPPAVTLTPARALIATHTTPDYPPVSRRLGEQGTLRLRLSITADGAVGEAVVETSSGFARLDAAAVEWVKGHWHYRPAMQGTRPVASTTSAVVTFELH